MADLLAVNDEELGKMRELAAEEREQEETQAEGRRVHRERALALCEDRLSRLADAFLDGDIDKEAYNLRKAQLLAERAGLRDEAIEPEASQADAILKKLELANTAYLGLGSPIPDDRRDAVQFLTLNLSAQGKELGFTLRFPFADIAKERISLNCAPCWTGPRTGRLSHCPHKESHKLI